MQMQTWLPIVSVAPGELGARMEEEEVEEDKESVLCLAGSVTQMGEV